MNDPVVSQLRQAVTAHGAALLQDPAQLEQLLVGFGRQLPRQGQGAADPAGQEGGGLPHQLVERHPPQQGQLRAGARADRDQVRAGEAAQRYGGHMGSGRVGCGTGVARRGECHACVGGRAEGPRWTLPGRIGDLPPASCTRPAAAVPAATATPAKAAGSPANPYAPPVAPVSDPAQEADEAAFIPERPRSCRGARVELVCGGLGPVQAKSADLDRQLRGVHIRLRRDRAGAGDRRHRRHVARAGAERWHHDRCARSAPRRSAGGRASVRRLPRTHRSAGDRRPSVPGRHRGDRLDRLRDTGADRRERAGCDRVGQERRGLGPGHLAGRSDCAGAVDPADDGLLVRACPGGVERLRRRSMR